MQYRIGDSVLDRCKFELRRDGLVVPAEPQVLSLLLMLVENRDRLISKDELVDAIWNGRAVSDSAISSRIKSARQLLGDDGSAQRLIRTVHGRGFRFVGDVRQTATAQASPFGPAVERPGEKPSIAILPFQSSLDPQAQIIAEGLPHEMIVALSRLRWLTVIARGSSFQFRSSEPDFTQIRGALNVRYCLTGAVYLMSPRISIAVELTDTSLGTVIWGERFEGVLSDIDMVREQTLSHVISALEVQIPAHEADKAKLCSSEDMNAWSSYHLGLQHVFRFDRSNNAQALHHFEQAVRLDPGFARAHAGISFARFQNAFLRYSEAIPEEIRLARSAATKAVELDELDPFASLMLGRSHWLAADVESSIPWLERAIALSPNYAHAIYSRAWAQMVLCRPDEGQQDAREAMRLSPIDPLRYGMIATEALSQFMLGNRAKAAELADRAAREPRAHVLIAVIAAACSLLAGDQDRANNWTSNVKARAPAFKREDFFRSFPFIRDDVRDPLAAALSQLGF